jgi:hypothetical protein
MKPLRTAVFAAAVCGFLVLAAGALRADPCLVVYPDAPCVYQYDPAEYYTVGPGAPLYNPLYDRGGRVLILTATNQIDLSIYQAPNLTGFEASTTNEGYYFAGTHFNLIIDGFNNSPTTYSNILVMFDSPVPSGCTPTIYAGANLVTGGVYHAGDLVVSTPTPTGHNYSDTKSVEIDWRGCYGVHIWAFADANYDGKKDGGECFTAFSHDIQIPTQDQTWGAIKQIFR